MMKPMTPDVSLSAEPQGMARLRELARKDPRSPEALQAVAQQFEALFTHMVLKNMREASLGDDLFDSESMKLYRDLHDQQLAQIMARGKGLGLADVMVRQLGGTPAAPAGARPVAPYGNRESFVSTLWPHANRVAKSLGIAPEAIVSIAALETGWGQSVMPGQDGRSSHNLFGIKADAGWTGARVMMPTLEYENGVAVKKTEPFRAYGSLAEAVDDFGRFVRGNPRYHQALAAGRDSEKFGQALAEAGYATDPEYGRKLAAILRGKPLQTALKSADAAPITG